MTLWQRVRVFFGADLLDVGEDWDDDFLDSKRDKHQDMPETPDGLWCPDTQPTSPGALDTLP